MRSRPSGQTSRPSFTRAPTAGASSCGAPCTTAASCPPMPGHNVYPIPWTASSEGAVVARETRHSMAFCGLPRKPTLDRRPCRDHWRRLSTPNELVWRSRPRRGKPRRFRRAMLDCDISNDSYAAERPSDPRVLALMSKTTVKEDPAFAASAAMRRRRVSPLSSRMDATLRTRSTTCQAFRESP
jgi:hypothetical protein